MNLSQLRAADAFTKVNNMKKNKIKYGKYKSYVQSLPATILMNGLGQAAAMLLAAAKGKKQDPHHLLYNHLSSWLCNKQDNEQDNEQGNGQDNEQGNGQDTQDNEQNQYLDAPYNGCNDLVEAITTKNEEDYLRAQAEALAYLEWLKKFANAYLEDDGNSHANNNNKNSKESDSIT